MIAVSVQNLTKKFKVYTTPELMVKEALTLGMAQHHTIQTAIDDVSFEVKKGETLGIIGQNGSGKSTLLRLLAGTSMPTAGTISIEGRTLNMLDACAGFDFDLTGRDNIIMSAEMHGYTKKETLKKIEEIILFSELENVIDYPVMTYSQGMILRLGFAILTSMDFDVLLIDEVFSVGDLSFRSKCMKKFMELKQNLKTVVFASHDLGDIGMFCDKILLLQNGKTFMYGKTEDVLKRYLHLVESESKTVSSHFEKDFIRKKSAYHQRMENLKIDAVSFYNNAGKKTDSFNTGESMQVEIQYTAKENIPDPLFRIQFFNSSGVFICGMNNYRLDCHISITPGKKTFTFLFDSLNLIDGDYYISVGIWPDEFRSYVTSIPYDYHEMAYLIHVKSQLKDGAGIVYLNASCATSDQDKNP